MNVIDRYKLQQSIFYDYNHIMTYQKSYKFIVAERGVGKTYTFKKFCLHQAIKYGYQFVWLRRTKEQVNEVKHKFMGDVKREFPEYHFQIRGDQIQAKKGRDGKWKKLGFMKSLSTVGNIRGAEYEKVRNIVYDEFIVDVKVDRYLDNEVLRYYTFIDTVLRLRYGNLIFLGNSESVDNPFFNALGITPTDKIGIQKGKDWVLEIPDTSLYRIARSKSMVGKLVNDTEYGMMANENKFLDNKANVSKRELLESKCTITSHKGTYGVWFAIDGTLHISSKTDPSKTIITFKKDSQNLGITYVNQSSPLIRQLRRKMEKGTLTFDTVQVKNLFIESLK